MRVKRFQPNELRRAEWVAREAAKIPAGSIVLDVGAGSGQYRHLFSHCDYRAHDFAQEPSTIGHYTPLDYISDITEIPLPDAAVDAVLCTEVLEHVPEPIKAVNEMARLTRDGGHLILSAPLGSFLHQEPFHFQGGLTPHWYEKFLPEAGFQIERIERNEGFFSFFTQEVHRFRELIRPWRRGVSLMQRLLLAFLWIVTMPISKVLLPVLTPILERMELEHQATVGYHVTAIRSRDANS